MRALEARGLAPRTVQYARAVLRRALRLALRWDLVTRNSPALVDPPRLPRRETEHLSADQVRRNYCSSEATVGFRYDGPLPKTTPSDVSKPAWCIAATRH